MNLIGAVAEEVLLDLLGKILAVARIDQVQAVLVDDHRLQLEPLLPCFLGDILEDALAEIARVRGKVETFGLAAKLDAIDGTCHLKLRRMDEPIIRF